MPTGPYRGQREAAKAGWQGRFGTGNETNKEEVLAGKSWRPSGGVVQGMSSSFLFEEVTHTPDAVNADPGFSVTKTFAQP